MIMRPEGAVLKILSMFELNQQLDARSASGCAFDFKSAAHGLCTLPHITQSLTFAVPQWFRRMKTTTIIFHQEFEPIHSSACLHPHLFGSGMFQRVGQSLLYNEKQIVPHLWRQRTLRQVVLQIQSAVSPVAFKELAGKMSDVLD